MPLLIITAFTWLTSRRPNKDKNIPYKLSRITSSTTRSVERGKGWVTLGPATFGGFAVAKNIKYTRTRHFKKNSKTFSPERPRKNVFLGADVALDVFVYLSSSTRRTLNCDSRLSISLFSVIGPKIWFSHERFAKVNLIKLIFGYRNVNYKIMRCINRFYSKSHWLVSSVVSTT